MKLLSRVVWSEGMYLGPHHFQAQGRYFEDSIQFATSNIWFRPYGLVGCELNAEALSNGTLSVVHARGVFPDGLVFHMPEADALPPARNIADLFPPTHDTLTVLFGLPPRREDGVNCAFSELDTAAARYLAEPRVLHDENTGADERAVRLGRKNVRLLLDTEPAGDMVTLPVARIMRDGAGHFVYDPSFIPPCIQITASRAAHAHAAAADRDSGRKGASIAPRRAGQGFTEFAARDIASFWLLHAVNAALAPLHAPVGLETRAPRGTVPRNVAPGRGALHLRARFAPARPAATTITTTWASASARSTATSARISKPSSPPTSSPSPSSPSATTSGRGTSPTSACSAVRAGSSPSTPTSEKRTSSPAPPNW